MLILLVDDDSEDREIFCEAIASIDPAIKCLAVQDGAECLSVLKELVVLPEYIFLDINMPVMNGLKCLKEIKKQKILAGILVIMYSTTHDKDEIQNAMKLGAEHFIVKPGNFNKLVASLKAVLEVGGAKRLKPVNA